MFKIYFAHPEFSPEQVSNAKFLVSEFSRASYLLGNPDFGQTIKLVDPFEFTMNVEGDREAKKELSKSILEVNSRLVRMSDLLLANIDDRDQGTMVEIGMAIAYGIPVISISFHDYDINAMLSGSVILHIANFRENSHKLWPIISAIAKATNIVNL